MWWFGAMHANLLLAFRLAKGKDARRLLDAGCGTGGLLARIAAAYPERAPIGLDADHIACGRAAAKSGRPVCAGSVDALPFPDAAFGAIFSADVLCHRNVREREALAQFYRCLSDDGLLVLNLPTYRWMLSRHDTAVYNVRRYTRPGVVRLLQDAGFTILFASYWNTLLFPLMVLTRKLLPGGDNASSDVKLYPAPVDAFCRAATGFERLLLRYRVHLPFGGSLIAVAAKQPRA
ncbi:MAG TPA: class I SAM-dependent methyltransferase [Stellaceae bacterium]|jgi:SAM-dependent methyltransferase|nr:class I SAM-dependent methyltransferase [Stellaceae bacterium]